MYQNCQLSTPRRAIFMPNTSVNRAMAYKNLTMKKAFLKIKKVQNKSRHLPPFNFPVISNKNLAYYAPLAKRVSSGYEEKKTMNRCFGKRQQQERMVTFVGLM